MVLFTTTAPVSAGEYTEALSACLIESTTTTDRQLLVTWMFAAASSHPALQEITTVDATQMDQLNKSIAGLLVRLIGEKCPALAREALNQEGQQAFESSFKLLGEMAGQELFGSPEVAGNLAGLERHIDVSRLQQLMNNSN